MKKLMTEWRKVLEGDVIKFELPPEEEPEMDSSTAKKINDLEDAIANLLAEFYGGSVHNQSRIPIAVLDGLDSLMKSIDENPEPES